MEIIIDEAQDFSPMMLRSLTLFAGENCSIMWIGDMGQCIFNNSRIPWKDVGMVVRRSMILKSNYRNTREIAAFADEIRIRMDLREEDALKTDSCVRTGKFPDVRIAVSEEQEQSWVTETVRLWNKAGSSVGIIVPTKTMVTKYSELLSAFKPIIINRQLEGFSTKQGLFIAHYHAIKGLEFSRIIMPGCVNEAFKDSADMREIESEEERKRHLASLIYTACTRARERLLITGLGCLVEQLPLYKGLCKANFPLKDIPRQEDAIFIEESQTEETEVLQLDAQEWQREIITTFEKKPPRRKNVLEEKQAVIHKKYGEGMVENVRDRYVTVKFGLEARTFTYPDCLERGIIRAK